MRNQEHEDADWHLGMELPSRKETHGRKSKKKSDRQQEVSRKREASAEEVAQPVPERADRAAIATANEDADEVEGHIQASLSAEERWQAYRDEVATTAALPMPGLSTPSSTADEEPSSGGAGRLPEDEQYLRELIFDQSTPADVIADGGQTAPIPDADGEADEEGPVIAWWKMALFCLLAPIVLVAVLAYGKLAYVHQVPDFVRQHVPAYQSGEGFLILKPWWFGPLVFAIDSYPMGFGQDFATWQTQFSDYPGVVQNPTVLYVFPQDLLH